MVRQSRVGTVSSLADFVFDICRSESQDIAGRVALLLWQIWAARNDVIGNDTHYSSTSIGRTTLDAWQQWQDVHKQPSPLVVQHRQNRVIGNNSVWEKPSETWLKCNVDVAFHERNHITTFACCVRDSRGQFIRAQTKWQRANMTVLEGKAVALLEALHFADANRWDRVVFESDSSTLVQALSSPGRGDSEFYAIVSSIIYLLSLHSNFEVKFVRRQANMVAHTLARAVCS
jgi:ribonuclease HI